MGFFYLSSMKTCLCFIRRVAVFLYLILAGAGLFAQTPEPFQKALKAFSDDAALLPASWSMSVYRISDSKPLVSIHPNTSLIPASVMKIVSTASALMVLGENFRFETHLLIRGKTDAKGVLQGDLIIRGYGDPTLGSGRWSQTRSEVVFDAWAKALKAAGINGINGRIIGDGTHWDLNLAADGWQYDDMGNYYASGVGGLNIQENAMQVFFEPAAAEGLPAKLLRTTPPLSSSPVINLVTTGPVRSGDKVIVYGGPYFSPRIFKGSVPAGVKEFVINASIPDPALACAYMLREHLSANGISVTGTPVSVIPGIFELNDSLTSPVHIHYSPPLHSILQQTNFNSINIFAEALLKAVSYRLINKTAYQDAAPLMLNFLKQRGINSDGVNIADGSGLSRGNLLTTEMLCRLMMLMHSDKRFPHFYASLPLAGENGTVRNFLKGKPIGYAYRVKSGYMNRVRAWAGYVENQKGDKICFALIVNNYNCSPALMRQKAETLLLQLSSLL